MSWQPERGWPSLLLRTTAALAAGALLVGSVMEARGVRIPVGDDEQAKVQRHEHAPQERQPVLGIMERVRIIDGSPARRLSASAPYPEGAP